MEYTDIGCRVPLLAGYPLGAAVNVFSIHTSFQTTASRWLVCDLPRNANNDLEWSQFGSKRPQGKGSRKL